MHGEMMMMKRQKHEEECSSEDSYGESECSI